MDSKLKFKFGDKFFECNIDNIKPNTGKPEHEKLKIYDCFINKNEKVLYLVGYEQFLPFWASENQLSKEAREQFDRKNNFGEGIDCKTLKCLSYPCDKKTRTVGEFLAVYNCGIICGFREIFGSESLVQTALFTLDLFDNVLSHPNIITYDDGCHLKKMIDQSEKVVFRSKRIEKLCQKTIVIDRFHYKGHKKKDDYCKKICNPDNYSDLNDINTSVVEQINYWFSGYKHLVKHMNRERFKFFVYLVCNELNESNINLQILSKL